VRVRSLRLDWEPTENALVKRVAERCTRGDLVDLTESNPTLIGLDYPVQALAQAFARAAARPYTPTPLGLPEARRAVAAHYARDGRVVDAERIVLTASSSESYAFLFKLFADPGDAVLVPEPSYPLFDYLARLEAARAFGYRLAYDGVWHIDFPDLERTLADATRQGRRPRAIVVVSPNNPTGSYVKRDEAARLGQLAARHELALISDEVFADYPHSRDDARVTLLAAAAETADAPAVFSLGGLSKGCGLPQLKLGWILVGGRQREMAIAGLEAIADMYLSVGGPVQHAVADLLSIGGAIRAAIGARVRRNRAALTAALAAAPAVTALPAEGGWSAILRLPAIRSDEDWASSLVTDAGVLVHPGYFFDLAGGTFLVISLLPEPGAFDDGLRRLIAHIFAAER
jgi:alanine-synthesizing transaminase